MFIKEDYGNSPENSGVSDTEWIKFMCTSAYATYSSETEYFTICVKGYSTLEIK